MLAVASACSSSDPIARPSDQTTSLAGRPAVTGSAATDPRAIHVTLTKVASVDAPTALVARPGHPDQIFIAERAGIVRLAHVTSTGTLRVQPTALADFRANTSTEGEQGFLGMAFAADGNTLYLSASTTDGDTRIAAAPVTGDTTPRLGARRTILTVNQPTTTNHKGGNLAFGPDGLLYLGLGDGGGQGDPEQFAQNPDVLLGKMLRFNPTTRNRDGQVTPTVFAKGLRNPWRFSFDAATGTMWIADVGQNEREEVNVIDPTTKPVVNFGWSRFEGSQVYDDDRTAPNARAPIFEEQHRDGACAITGGFVYRGAKIPSLVGNYIYTDLCHGGLRVLQPTATSATGIPTKVRQGSLAATDDAKQVISFGVDADNEVYVLSLTGTIWRIDPTR